MPIPPHVMFTRQTNKDMCLAGKEISHGKKGSPFIFFPPSISDPTPVNRVNKKEKGRNVTGGGGAIITTDELQTRSDEIPYDLIFQFMGRLSKKIY